MINPDRNLSPQQLRLLCSWVLVVGTLWLVVLWNLGLNNPDLTRGIQRSSIVTTLDIPLHSSGDYSLSLKRSVNRYSPQFKSPQLKPIQLTPRQYSPIESSDFFSFFLFNTTFLLLLSAAVFFYGHRVFPPSVSTSQLLTLNISRAPPAI